MWSDHYHVEIIDPDTLEPVAAGEVGDVVVTTQHKEATSLIRYRTRDLSFLYPGPARAAAGTRGSAGSWAAPTTRSRCAA